MERYVIAVSLLLLIADRVWRPEGDALFGMAIISLALVLTVRKRPPEAQS